MNDPYCGWCALSSSCTTKDSCVGNDLANGWNQDSTGTTCIFFSSFLLSF